MNRILTYGLVTLMTFATSCEDVIDVELQPEEPRLIINGVVKVDKSQEFIDVRIRVSESSNFFEENTITQLDDAVILYGEANPDAPEILEEFATSELEETSPGTGIYIPSYIPGTDTDERIRSSSAFPGVVFILVVEHKGRRYAARTPYAGSVPIDTLEQGDGTLFDENETEVVVTFTDVAEEENFYVFDFGFGNFLAVEDQFFDGQQFEFSYFYDQEFEAGQELEVSLLGADLEFYNYIDLLVEQTEDTGGVFQTPSAVIRGNVFDVTGIDNINIFDNVDRPDGFGLGYFAVVEEFKQSIVIE